MSTNPSYPPFINQLPNEWAASTLNPPAYPQIMSTVSHPAMDASYSYNVAPKVNMYHASPTYASGMASAFISWPRLLTDDL